MHHVVVTMLLVVAMATMVSVGLAEPETASLDLPPVEKMLDNLKKTHPRVMANAGDFERVRELIHTEEQAKAWYKRVKDAGEKMLSAPPTAYEIPDGLRLLAQSRNTLDRAATLGLLYRIEGDTRYRDRIWKDMEAAAAFKDWNPRHFLDTGEMTCAFAVAYDWLYDAWTPEQRTVIREAIVRHGLKVALDAYRAEKPPSWTRSHGNWNQVTNGGISVGAVAIADEEPDLAAEILHHALGNLPVGVAALEPDGACVEGPGYWGYANRYFAYLVSTLDAAFGRDFGLTKLPAVDRLGDFPVLVAGPSGKTFNFADCSEYTLENPCLLWLARRFDRPDWAAYQIGHASGTPWDLLWYDPKLASAESRQAPLDVHFHRIDVAVMRSSWGDPNAWYLACKAGDNRFPHGQLDVGTFVLEAMGERWAIDLGSDNYNLPGYWSGGRQGTRWTYYRMRAQGHNTLVTRPGDYSDQVTTAAKAVSFDSSPERCVFEIDMTPVYADWAKTAHRTFHLDRPRGGTPFASVRDDIELAEPCDVYWFMHTRAEVTIASGGRRAELRLGGKTLYADLIEPAGARFEVLDAAPLPGTPNPKDQATNKGVRRLAVHLEGVDKTAIEVRFAGPP
jgi:hypothetical protein